VAVRSIAWLDLFGVLSEDALFESCDIEVDDLIPSAGAENEFVVQPSVVLCQSVIFRHPASRELFSQVRPLPVDAVGVIAFNENGAFEARSVASIFGARERAGQAQPGENVDCDGDACAHRSNENKISCGHRR
jgi:hypothetical protein